MDTLWKFCRSRIILPLNHEYEWLDEKPRQGSTSTSTSGSLQEQPLYWRILISIWFSIKYFIRIRIRVNHKVTIPILTALVPLVVLIALTVTLIVLSAVKTGHILPQSNPLPKLREINNQFDKTFVYGCLEPAVDEPRANAVLVVLARNQELEGVSDSMRSLERHFNRWFNYPYVFLNDEPFNSTFIEGVSNLTNSDCKFGTIPEEDWNFPDWADREDIEEGIASQGDRAIMYGSMESYHHMCRFYSGKFYNHELLKPYDWYWRVEPDVKYFCDITYDPFKYMQKHNKVYGFTIFIKELVETVPNLFRYTSAFKRSRKLNTTDTWEVFIKKPDLEELGSDQSKDSGSVRKKKIQELREKKILQKQELENLLKELPDEAVLGTHLFDNKEDDEPVSEDEMESEAYNMCHFWSNFEIARLDFFRSKEYNDYFEYMDKSGGFWNERWGDAPIHSLAAGLYLQPEQIHYFRDIGYRHTTIQHCPGNAPHRQRPHIPYITNPNDPLDLEDDEYWSHPDPEVMNGVGCRCRCDTDIVDVEGKDGSCLNEWVDLMGGWL